jgi:hypothetical protein
MRSFLDLLIEFVISYAILNNKATVAGTECAGTKKRRSLKPFNSMLAGFAFTDFLPLPLTFNSRVKCGANFAAYFP